MALKGTSGEGGRWNFVDYKNLFITILLLVKKEIKIKNNFFLS
jgi:hypothetical protein